MKYINEKVAYLKGLSEGMKLAEASDEGKMIGQLLVVLEEDRKSTRLNSSH